MGGLVIPALNGERRGVDAHLHRGRPVGVHLPVFVVIALKLKLQVWPVKCTNMLASFLYALLITTQSIRKYVKNKCRPHHEGLVDGVSQLEDVVADG